MTPARLEAFSDGVIAMIITCSILRRVIVVREGAPDPRIERVITDGAS